MGGLALGLHASGFTPVAVVDSDKGCIETLKANQIHKRAIPNDWPIFQGDIRCFDFPRFKNNVHLLSGGPPCQPFSVGGRGAAHSDSRNMFPDAIRVLREVLPLAFVFENVPGLLTKSRSEYLDYIVTYMSYPLFLPKIDESWQNHFGRMKCSANNFIQNERTYRVEYRLIDAANFGVAQNRRRLFIVGFRSDLAVGWNFPGSTHSRSQLINEKNNGVYWKRHRLSLPDSLERHVGVESTSDSEKPLLAWQTVRDATSDLGEPMEIRDEQRGQFEKGHILHPGAKPYVGHSGSSFDMPSKTLKAGVHGVPGGENMLRLQSGAVRYFSIRECARLQTFPDNFVFGQNWSATMRQIGNAVPPILAKAIGDQLAKVLAPHKLP